MTIFWVALVSVIAGGFIGMLITATLLTITHADDDPTQVTEAYQRGFGLGLAAGQATAKAQALRDRRTN